MGIVNSWESSTQELNRNENGHYEYTRTINVYTDDNSIPAEDIVNYVGIGHRASHPANPYALCTGLNPVQTNDFLWEVKARYSTESNQTDDPLTFDEVRSGSANYADQIIFRDINLDAIINSAKQPFADPVPTRQQVIPQINRQINLPWNSYSESYFMNRCGKINSTAWGGFAPRTMRCNVSYTQANVFQNGVQTFYWQTQWTFAFNPDEWTLKLLDAGYVELVSGQLRQIRDKNGEPVTSPHCLKSNGEKLPEGDPGHFLEFDVYDEENFNSYPISPPS